MLIEARKKELLVLQMVIQKNNCSLQELSNDLHIPKRTIKELIRKINVSLKQFLLIDEFIYSNHKGEIQTKETGQTKKLAVFSKLKLCYLKESNRFNYLMLLINYPQTAVPKKYLLEQLYISPSYLEKLTKQLNHSLKKFHLRILSVKNCCTLEGNKLSIRLYLYFFLSDTFGGNDWPFSSLELNALKMNSTDEQIEKISKQEKNIYLLLTLFILRNKQQAYFPKTSSEITELMDLLQHTHDYSEYFTSFSVSRPCEETETERAYFNYFFYCFFPNQISFRQKQEIGFLFSTSKNLICRQVGQLMTYLTQQFPLNHLENKIPIYFYFLVLAVVFFELLGESSSSFSTLCFPEATSNHSSSFIQEKKLREKIDTIFSKNGERNQISQYLSQLIQHLLQTETKEQLLIHLQITKQFTGNYHLQSHLQQLFRKDAVKITAYSEHADLIITDQHEKISDETETFYLDTTHNTVLFGELIKAVHELYMKKSYENKTKRM
ncbi:TPA: M protein trans-acting positive regulator [Enterococcus faecium]|nr:M protein trans-acting positive regulator [Enterococcus faecium]